MPPRDAFLRHQSLFDFSEEAPCQLTGLYLGRVISTKTMPMQHWRLQSLEGSDDYGYDYQVQTTPNQRATDIFRIQLKGIRSPNLTADGEYISVALKASTVRYYARAVEPVLLVICDLSVNEAPVDCPFYYVWIRDELIRITVDDLSAEQKYVTFARQQKTF